MGIMPHGKRIACITQNVSVDHTYVVPNCAPGLIWRARETLVTCGGKGVNVARAIRLLGGVPICTGFLAGHTGQVAAELARAEGLQCCWSWIEGVNPDQRYHRGYHKWRGHCNQCDGP